MAELTQPIAGGPSESDAGGMVSAWNDACLTRAAEAGPGDGEAPACAAAGRRGAVRLGGNGIDGRGAIHGAAVTYEPRGRVRASARSAVKPGSGLPLQAAHTRETMKPMASAW